MIDGIRPFMGADGKLRHQAQVSAGFDPETGARIRKIRTFETRREAKAWRNSQRSAADRGEIVLPSKVTVGEWMVTYIESKRKIRESTRRQLSLHAAHITRALGTVPIQKLTKHQIVAFVYGLGGQGSHQRAVYRTLRAALRAAVDNGLLAKVIKVHSDELPAASTARRRALTVDEVDEILVALDKRHASGHLDEMWTAAKIVRHTGMRIGEVCGLTWNDIALDSDPPTIRVERTVTLDADGNAVLGEDPKSAASRRTLGIDRELASILARFKRGQTIDAERCGVPAPTLVFPASLEEPERPRRRFNFKYRLRGSKFADVQPHALRHSYGSWLHGLGISPADAAARMGHTVAEYLRTYVHRDPESDARIVSAVERLFSGPVADGVGSDAGENVLPFRASANSKG